jgi:hypothetical protein
VLGLTGPLRARTALAGDIMSGSNSGTISTEGSLDAGAVAPSFQSLSRISFRRRSMVAGLASREHPATCAAMVSAESITNSVGYN